MQLASVTYQEIMPDIVHDTAYSKIIVKIFEEGEWIYGSKRI